MSNIKLPLVPKELVGGVADLLGLITSIELIRGRDKSDAEALVALVPEPIRQAPCFLDRLTGRWLYEFGDPVTTSAGQVRGVGITFHAITTLIDVVACARNRLGQSVLYNYLTRVADPAKHADMLFEFAPILRLDPATKAEYEVVGESPGNKTIDWKIEGEDGVSLLLEVKYRNADLIRSFERIQAGERAPDGSVPAPDHDTDLLFRSVEGKFLPRSPSDVLQGVWIHTALMQEGDELEQSFMRLDPKKVHFAIVGSWDPGVYVLARNGVQPDMIMQRLRVHQVERFVFKRGGAGRLPDLH